MDFASWSLQMIEDYRAAHQAAAQVLNLKWPAKALVAHFRKAAEVPEKTMERGSKEAVN
jgi:hypothetical protein